MLRSFATYVRHAHLVSSKSHVSRVRIVKVAANWGAPVEFASATIVHQRAAADQLVSLELDLGSRTSSYTRPGQYLQLKIKDSKPAFIAVASPPNTKLLSLLIKSQPGTTSELLCALKAGDVVDASPVMGKGFALETLSPSTSHLILFATGSGISPIKALIESGALSKFTHVKLYYGARCVESMAYRDLFGQWKERGVHVIPVLSQPKGNWNGARGYVQDELKNGLENVRGAETGVVLCGHKGMVEAVKGVLGGVGVEQFLLNF